MTDPIETIRFGDDELISAAIQDTHSGDLLMVGFMNREALDATRASGYVHFWSRSRGKLWKKGETSGHVQRVEEIRINCELNSLLIEVEQVGAVCHEGYDTCYYRRLEPDGGLTTVRDRPDGGQPAIRLEASVVAGVVTFVADCADLLDFDQETVQFAVDADFFDPLHVSRRFPLFPQLPATPAPEVDIPACASCVQGFPVHEAHHQQIAGVGVLNRGGDELVVAEPDGFDRISHR